MSANAFMGGSVPQCRHCDAHLRHTLVDLGSSPLCNTLLDEDALQGGEPFYPLHVRVCDQCFLAQLGQFVSPEEIFEEYSYFSSFSDSWVAHAEAYVCSMIERFSLDSSSKVIEVASNDGYLLRHFVARSIAVLGVEPALNVALEARRSGIPTLTEFLGSESGSAIRAQHGAADLVVANNVLAHTPHLNDFISGLRRLLKDEGVVTVEFPHLMRLIEHNQFDTIYHEHFSYFSFYAVERVFASGDMRIFDVEELSTHGGSLRIYAVRDDSSRPDNTARLTAMREFERSRGVTDLDMYSSFSARVEATKRDLLECLIGLRRAGERIVGYGAPGKGNTLLNYCGIRTDFIEYLVDRNPYKQGKFTPGTRIPIRSPDVIAETKPDYVLIMPWNLKDEILGQLDYARSWGAKFIVPIPRPTVEE